MQFYDFFNPPVRRYELYEFLNLKSILNFHSSCKITRTWALLDLENEKNRFTAFCLNICEILANNRHASAPFFSSDFLFDKVTIDTPKELFDLTKKVNAYIQSFPLSPANINLIYPFCHKPDMIPDLIKDDSKPVPRQIQSQNESLQPDEPLQTDESLQADEPLQVLSDVELIPFLSQLDDPVAKSRMYDYLTFLINDVNDQRTTYYVITRIPEKHCDLYHHCVSLMCAKLLINQAVDVMKNIPEKEQYEELLIECINIWLKVRDEKGFRTGDANTNAQQASRMLSLGQLNAPKKDYTSFVQRCIYVLSNRKDSNIILLNFLDRMNEAGEVGLPQYVLELLQRDLDAAVSFIQELRSHDAYNNPSYRRFIYSPKNKITEACIAQRQFYDALALSLQQPYGQKATVKLCCEQLISDSQENASILLGFVDPTADLSIKSTILSCCIGPYCQTEGYEKSLQLIAKYREQIEKSDHEKSLYICFTYHFKENQKGALAALENKEGPYKLISHQLSFFITMEFFKQTDLELLERATESYLTMKPELKKQMLDGIVDSLASSHQIETFFYLMDQCPTLSLPERKAYYSKLDHPIMGLGDATEADHFVNQSYDPIRKSKTYTEAIKCRAERVSSRKQSFEGLFNDINKISQPGLRYDVIHSCIQALLDSDQVDLAISKMRELLGQKHEHISVATKKVVAYYLRKKEIDQAFIMSKSIQGVDFNSIFNDYTEKYIAAGDVDTAQKIQYKLSFE